MHRIIIFVQSKTVNTIESVESKLKCLVTTHAIIEIIKPKKDKIPNIKPVLDIKPIGRFD